MNPGKFKWANSALTLGMMLLLSLKLFAQDKKVDVDIDVNKGGEWYTQPWAWVVGGAIFILLLVALLRGRNAD